MFISSLMLVIQDQIHLLWITGATLPVETNYCLAQSSLFDSTTAIPKKNHEKNTKISTLTVWKRLDLRHGDADIGRDADGRDLPQQ